ncbi:dnaJ protein homolog ANJ1-like [Arachis ipaensis]|uniref:dnaJ protein homolog ANJ1-like n=1 Tax=Arachis ipaensis TaxID=130454 RepID=UPI000A2B670F|nr:dnaJ protein homolog ANJ1-like [Arachis ipaensis]XP_025628698.1 dnaJ protein homolog ANJ1-like [Arachis hypogaea]
MRKCKSKTVHCSFNSPSNGSGSTAENFDENDEDYVNSSVVETVEFKELAQAYEVLSETEKCEIYDQYGEDALKEGMGGGHDPFDIFQFVDGFFEQVVLAEGGGRKGETMWFIPSRSRLETYTSEHLRSSRSLTMYFAQSAMGKYNHIKISSYCKEYKSGNSTKCAGCQGTGMKVSIRHLGPSIVQQMQHPCSECKGTGETISDRDRCPQCKGKKVVQEKKVLEVHVD